MSWFAFNELSRTHIAPSFIRMTIRIHVGESGSGLDRSWMLGSSLSRRNLPEYFEVIKFRTSPASKSLKYC